MLARSRAAADGMQVLLSCMPWQGWRGRHAWQLTELCLGSGRQHAAQPRLNFTSAALAGGPRGSCCCAAALSGARHKGRMLLQTGGSKGQHVAARLQRQQEGEAALGRVAQLQQAGHLPWVGCNQTWKARLRQGMCVHGTCV